MQQYYKYPRTPHLPFSRSRTEDDKVLKDTEHFNGKNVVVTYKMDGENTSLYPDHIHARSLDSKDHPSRAWVKAFWGSIRHDIPEGMHICGENLYAQHSLAYTDLSSYFLGFSIWAGEYCLDWDETLHWFALLGITPVPEVYRGPWDLRFVMDLAERLDTSKVEGLVVRIAGGFDIHDFGKSVAKYVRKGHVQTDEHWMHKAVIPNKLAK